MKNKIRHYCSSFIPENEIIHNTMYLDGELFIRYYHQNIIPTRYFFSVSGKIYSEITRNFIEPQNYWFNTKNGKSYESDVKGIRMYIRINDKVKRVTRKLESIIDTLFKK